MGKKSSLFSLLTIMVLVISSCNTQKPLPKLPPASIARHPEPVDFSPYFPKRDSVPTYDPETSDPFLYDFRSSDVTNLDFSKSLELLNNSSYDSKTKWPSPEKMPAGFSAEQIMELGKDPGLGIRSLHADGITGRGIGIAIIDQTLLVDHQEYVNQLQLFEDGAGIEGDWLTTSMHGPAVASIAVGKTVGVAPDADLYFITMGDCNGAFALGGQDFTCLAKDVLRVIEINKGLPEERKIRVISMSIGWRNGNTGYNEITDAIEKAQAAGIFVISTSIYQTYGFNIHGMARPSMADPNDFSVYLPGIFWANDFYSGAQNLENTLLIPMDARTTASPNGLSDYVHYSRGGWSWIVPYLAGVYALACQVNPEITPDVFWAAAMKTGRTIQIEHDGKQYSFGVILDPQSLLNEIKQTN